MDDRTTLPARLDEITTKNVLERILAYCKVRSAERGGMHPVIRKGDPEFMLWWEYFARHVGKIPWVFQLTIDDPSRRSYTVPELDPSWFDHSFRPMKGWMPPRECWQDSKSQAEREEHVANIKRQLSEHGFSFAGATKSVDTAGVVMGKYGVSREQWNAIPDLPRNHEDKAANKRR